MKRTFIIFILCLFPSAALSQPEDPFLWDFGGQVRTLRPGAAIPLEVTFRIPPRYYLYKDKMGLSFMNPDDGQRFQLGPLEFSPSFEKKDPFSDKTLQIFEDVARIRLPLTAKPGQPPGDTSLGLRLTYQGCSDTLCYRMMRKEISVPLRIEGVGQWASASVTTPFKSRTLILSLFLTFLGGIASDFTPCVLPIIPITLAFIGVRREGREIGRNFVLSLFLILSMALTYAVMGLLAAVLGKSLGFLFQNIYFLVSATLLYFFFALSLFGAFDFQLPLGVRNLFARLGGQGVLGASVAGVTIGFLAAPCVGPLIASLLLYVAQERDLAKGFALLFSYGLGMGSLFLIIGTYYHRLASKVHGGNWTVWVKKTMAVLMLIPACYYGSIACGHFRKADVVSVTQESFWNLDAPEALARAKSEGRPVFMDFFATWCLPCVHMEGGTFSDPDLQKFLLEKFVPVKVDCTQETDQCKAMVERYSVVGWPTFLILDPKGEVADRIVGRDLSTGELREILGRVSF